MSEFTFLFRGRETTLSLAQRQKHTEKWIAWFKNLADGGHLKDRGHPLDGEGKVVRGKRQAVNDGPYAEAKDVVAGYCIVEAANLTAAADLAKGCPILQAGGSVEIRPIRVLQL